MRQLDAAAVARAAPPLRSLSPAATVLTPHSKPLPGRAFFPPQVEEQLGVVRAACTQLRDCEPFLKVLQAVLELGNHLNAGTHRGGAAGFKLDTLLQLADVKGTDRKTSLLQVGPAPVVRVRRKAVPHPEKGQGPGAGLLVQPPEVRRAHPPSRGQAGAARIERRALKSRVV